MDQLWPVAIFWQGRTDLEQRRKHMEVLVTYESRSGRTRRAVEAVASAVRDLGLATAA